MSDIAQRLLDNPTSGNIMLAVHELRRLSHSEALLMLAARAPAEVPGNVLDGFYAEYQRQHPKPEDKKSAEYRDWRVKWANAQEEFVAIGWPAYYARTIAEGLAK